jgi:hypothetical protein
MFNTKISVFFKFILSSETNLLFAGCKGEELRNPNRLMWNFIFLFQEEDIKKICKKSYFPKDIYMQIDKLPQPNMSYDILS